ncbi:MAG: protein-L-isoaspartate O-methyltransferase [Gammaproteobacteria bacterium]|nr:protein-L-isoaspartate O-methyltransferase [Gammaproteobacteria bacterium]MBT8123425.1 protein-L-isoaspartate O-methyltransferase [Gammaproteobacteria bacterium]MDH3608037.1 protein-L-isoaspartate O-methyltransferase [Gammaproteobacteria bacterium]NNC68086.1 protein-L-isoaspartate O-methyltransferase [Gammaproteobacteria bacterium]
MDIEQARFNMIEQQIRPWDVLDVDVLKVIEDTPREFYVPTQHQKLAFSDLEIPLDHDQFMMSPKLEARMLQALQIQVDDKVLEIGTGSGFVTACLAKLGKHVDTIEYYSDLSTHAQTTLQKQQIRNISFKVGDVLDKSFFSNQINKQYDVIAITASMPVYSDIFEDFLKENGRLFVVAGKAPVMHARLITRIDNYGFTTTNLFETDLQPLIGMHAPQVFEL